MKNYLTQINTISKKIREQYKLKDDDNRYILSYICRIDLQKDQCY